MSTYIERLIPGNPELDGTLDGTIALRGLILPVGLKGNKKLFGPNGEEITFGEGISVMSPTVFAQFITDMASKKVIIDCAGLEEQEFLNKGFVKIRFENVLMPNLSKLDLNFYVHKNNLGLLKDSNYMIVAEPNILENIDDIKAKVNLFLN